MLLVFLETCELQHRVGPLELCQDGSVGLACDKPS